MSQNEGNGNPNVRCKRIDAYDEDDKKKKKKNIERFYQTIIKCDEVFFSLLLFLSPQRESEIFLRMCARALGKLFLFL